MAGIMQPWIGRDPFGRWLPNGRLRWVQLPALVIVIVVLVTGQHPLAVLPVLILPILAWVGFTRHERSVATLKGK
jgi:hypothetical protein